MKNAEFSNIFRINLANMIKAFALLLFRNCVKCFLVVWIFNQNAVREVFAVFQLLVYPLQQLLLLLLLLCVLLLVSNTKRA